MGIALDVAQDVVFRNFNNTGVTDVVRVQTTTGKVLIGNNTTNIASNDYRLFVQTGILTERVRVAVRNSGDWADYVFDKTYKLPTLKSVESFISKNKHLPDVPSAATVQAEGIDLAKMDAVLLKKIEELTLYMIDLNKSVQTLKAENQALKAQIKSIQK